MNDNFKNILVVNVNWMGDVIFSSPVFMALHEQYPQAKITCLAVPRVKPVLELIPYVDEIIVFHEKRLRWNIFSKILFLLDIRRRGFDVVFLLHGSRSRAQLMSKSGIAKRVGYERKNRGLFLTDIIPVNKTKFHRSDYYLEIIKSFGVPVNDSMCVLTVPINAKKEIDELLARQGVSEDDFCIVVNTGGNWDLKQWPEENFCFLVEKLIRDLKVRVILSGAECDVERVKRIVKFCDDVNCEPIDLTGKTSISQLVALMQRANIVVSSDSGPLHVASAVGTSVIGIFGPTRPEVTGPRGSGRVSILQQDVGCNREPCYKLDCPDHVCMEAITVEEVVSVVRQIKNS